MTASATATATATDTELQGYVPVDDTDTAEFEITVDVFPVRLADGMDTELPVVHRTRHGQFVVVDNRLAKARTPRMRPVAHPFFVVHVASGLRSPVPSSVGKHTLATARQLADFLELAQFFDAETGRPTVPSKAIITAIRSWRP